MCRYIHDWSFWLSGDQVFDDARFQDVVRTKLDAGWSTVSCDHLLTAIAVNFGCGTDSGLPLTDQSVLFDNARG